MGDDLRDAVGVLMTERIADDFAFIAARIRELRDGPPDQASSSSVWWCEDCGKHIDGAEVTNQERHDERSGGCGCFVEPWCQKCDNGGWVQVYSQRPPCFDTCPGCFNPHDRDSP